MATKLEPTAIVWVVVSKGGARPAYHRVRDCRMLNINGRTANHVIPSVLGPCEAAGLEACNTCVIWGER